MFNKLLKPLFQTPKGGTPLIWESRWPAFIPGSCPDVRRQVCAPEVSAKCAEATPEGGTLHSGKRLGALWVETVGNSADMLTVCLMCLFAAGGLAQYTFCNEMFSELRGGSSHVPDLHSKADAVRGQPPGS